MARPTTKPRLSTIDADHIVEFVGSALRERANAIRYLMDKPALGEDDIGDAANLRAIIRYAQTGEDASSYECWPVLNCLTHALFTPPSERVSFTPEHYVGQALSADESLGLVLLAAFARFRLEADDWMMAPQLAALAEVTPDHIRLLTRRGDLTHIDPMRQSTYAAPEARRFLRSRGTKGIRDEFEPDDNVTVWAPPDWVSRPPSAPTELRGKHGIIEAVQDDPVLPCSVRFEDGATRNIKPRWLLKRHPLEPPLWKRFGKYGERRNLEGS